MEEIFRRILAKYIDIMNMFLKKIVIEVPKLLGIKKNAIKIKIDKKLFYRLIYSLKLVQLKTLKAYIKINLRNSFI